ncbi:MAG: DNA-directed RNA polymerase subunit L [archaeon]|nr:DNA-directed RNA polymerase subunit L [archaeon]
MQITVVNQNENTTRLSLKDVNTTVIEAVIDGLNKDANVDYARYIVDHPDLTDPMLEVKVNKGTVKEALQKATSAFAEYFAKIDE